MSSNYRPGFVYALSAHIDHSRVCSPHSAGDTLRNVLEALKADEECTKIFKDFAKLPLERGGGLKKMFEDKAYETRQGIQRLEVKTITLDTMTIWLGPDFVGDGAKCKNILKDITVEPTPQVTGNTERPRHSNLSNHDLKGAYSTAQKKGGDNSATGEGGMGIDYEEFCWLLGLCGHIKYAPVTATPTSTATDTAPPPATPSMPPHLLPLATRGRYEEIEEMTLPMRVEGIIRNFLQEEDEHKVCASPIISHDSHHLTCSHIT